MQLSTDLEIAGLLTRISLNSEGLIYSTLLRITSDNLKVSNENFSTIYSNNILISTEILNTVIIFELIKTVVNLNLSNEDLELLLHPFGEKIYTQLHFSPFIDWDFDPNSIWVPLASNSSNQINISHLTSALTNYVTFEDIEGLIPSPSININVINDWGLAITSEDVLGATLGYYLKEEQIRIEDKIDNLFYFTNNTTTSRYPLNINGDLNVFNNIHATGGVSAGGIGDLFESGGVGFTGVVEEKTGNSNVVTGGHKDDSNIVFEMALEVYSKDDTNDLLDTKVDKVAGYGLSQNNLTDGLIQSINNSASAYHTHDNKVILDGITSINLDNWDDAYTHSQITDGTNPHATTFANIASKPTTISGYGITDAYTKTHIDDNFVPYVGALKDVNLGEYSLSLFNLNASNNIHAEGGVSAGGIGDLAETTSIIDLYRSWDDLHPTNKALEATLGVELHNSLTGLSSASHTHSNKDVLDSTTAAFLHEEKIKLAGIEANANKYTLPYATSAILGGVIIGSNIDINDGVISVKDASTLNKGVVQLSDSIGSPSSLIAATSKAVKAAWDLADSKWLWNENTIKGVVVNRSLTADKLTAPISLWGQLFDGSSDVNGDLHSTGNISADGGVSAGGIGDLSEAITSGYNNILPHPDNMGNAVTSITSNGGSTIYYRMLKNFSEVGHKHDTVYSLLGHIHDDRYYTEVEISNILSGLTSATGYNKSNWDTAYDWGNHDSVGYALDSTLSTHMDNVSNPHAVTKTQVGLGNVEDTKLSTWTGTANITTLGTISSGTWNATTIGVSKGGTGKTSIAIDRMLYASSANTYSEVITTSFGRGILSAISGTEVAGLRAATATKLASSVYLWGNEFNGTQSLDGHIESIGDIHTTQRIYGDAGVYAGGIGDLAESNSGGYNDIEYVGSGNYVANVESNVSSLKVFKSYMPTLLSQFTDNLGSSPIHTHSQYMLASLKGTANGLAELDSNGLVPASQLPSYVDDVLTYSSLSVFPATGIDGKIYIASDTNLTYRWSGTAYVEISKSLALGETVSTAYRGDRGKIAYDHSQASHSFSIAGQNINALDGSISKASLLSALNVANGAQVNVLEGIKLNGTALTPDSKVVNVNACTSITVPTGLSVAALKTGGLIAISLTNGYAIPTSAKVAQIATNTTNINTLQGYFTDGSAKSAIKLLNARTLWGRSFDGTANVSGNMTGVGSIESTGNIHTTQRVYGDSGVFSGGIGDLAESGSSGYNRILLQGTGNAVTSISDNGGSTLFYNRDKTFSEASDVANSLDTKVDKVTGYGLSKNDLSDTLLSALNANTTARHSHSNKAVLDATTASFLTAEKTKLNGIATNANNYSLPTASSNVLGGIKVGTRLTIASGVLSADVQSDYNFNSTYKTKLEGIAAGANLYTHPTYTDRTSGLYKITVNSLGHVTAAVAVAKSDITALGVPSQDTVYTHPTGDGNLHVPATGTANNTKVLKAGSTAGSLAWGAVAWSEIASKPSTFTPSAHTHDDRYYTETEIGNLFSGSTAIAGYNRTNWNAAYGWGDHNSAGYAAATALSSHTGNSTIHITSNERTNWNDAYSWGDHQDAGYAAYSDLATHTGNSNIHITAAERTNWDTAFGWGNHQDAGYAAATALSSHVDNSDIHVNSVEKTHWNIAYNFANEFNTNHPDIASIEALTGTSGLLRKTAANTWSLDTAAYITGITKAMVEEKLTGNITSHTHSQYLTAHQTIYALTIQKNGTTVATYTPNSAAKTINISDVASAATLASHTANVSNPHGVTKTQVGLGNVENAAASGLYVPLTRTVAGLALGSNIATSSLKSALGLGSAAYRAENYFSFANHTHGNVTNAGYIGSTANLPIITGTGGILQVGSFGTAANTFCQGNDSRLSNARIASDVYAWAKASAKPSYTYTEVGAAAASHTHIQLYAKTDNRSVATAPNDYNNYFTVAGLKQSSTVGTPMTGTYVGIIGWRQWSDSSGGPATELAFGDEGIAFRQGATTSWGGWNRLIHSGNYNDYAPTKTGTGASGTWGISISGNASTATKLYTGRTLKVNLASTSASTSFNGTANVSDIGVSGILPTSNGGTGNNTFVSNKLIYATSATKLSSMSSTVGSTSVPIYLNEGAITACTSSQLFSLLSWNNGTTSGPTLNITVTGQNKTSVIPSASASYSGIVTTGTQTFAGLKTFKESVSILTSLSVADNINAGGIIQGVGGVFAGGIADLGGSAYAVPTASASSIGGIKIGYTTYGKNYKVQLDVSGNAFVNVPWTNTVYSAGNGISIDGTTISNNGVSFITESDVNGCIGVAQAYNGGTYTDIHIHGLGSAAYTNSSAYASSSHNHSGVYEPVISTKNTAFNVNFGTVSGTACQGNDSRLSNARTPSAHTLDSHSNVTITSNSSGEILKWNGSAWINNTLAEAGIAASTHTHAYASTVKLGTVAYAASSNIISLPAYPTTLPASDVSAWAKAATKPSYAWNEITSKPLLFASVQFADVINQFSSYKYVSGTELTLPVYGQTSSNPLSDSNPLILKSGLPTSLPASDVSAWAKASSKPSYTYSEVGAAAASHTHSQYLEETSWTTPTLTNGTQGTTYGAVRYRLIGTNVQIDGSFTVTISNTDGLRIFTLPTGYRPVHKMSMLMYNNSGGIWRCVVSTDGSVYVNYIYRITNGSLITTATMCMFDKCIFPIN